jgi:polar amino acid transport system substrate-binding protein
MTRVTATIVCAALAFAFTAEVAARDLQEVRKSGTLRVGVTLFAPWAARGADGELVGFEVDVAQQLSFSRTTWTASSPRSRPARST